jgi:chaperonin GroES
MLFPRCWFEVGRISMKLEPLGDHVVVERLEAEAKTAGGIILPDTAREKPKRGRVRAVGPGRRLKDGRLVPLQVRPGDEVLFSAYAGDEFRIDGKEVLLMREEDILAVVEAA